MFVHIAMIVFAHIKQTVLSEVVCVQEPGWGLGFRFFRRMFMCIQVGHDQPQRRFCIIQLMTVFVVSSFESINEH